ncbi:MAG TPA: ArsA-related P-loop ATPase [Solirubrobacteraceae bacterium]|nr:ArsA-related P-loop ATPase [Solirubrobacteraceae bacterium]
MKLAIAGKGGSGKTSISGTMARLLARDGHNVLAIDGDSNPNLALTLGIPADRMSQMPVLPSNLLRRTEAGPVLTQSLEDIKASHSVTGPDGVELLVMAHPQHADTGCLCSMHATVRRIIEAASDEDRDVCILDTEASPEHLSRGTAAYAEVMLVVVEPYFKSLETGRRMAALANDLGLDRVALIANKVRDERELEAVQSFAANHDLEIAAVVPFDETFALAERDGVAPLDYNPDSPAIAPIARLAAAWGVNAHERA